MYTYIKMHSISSLLLRQLSFSFTLTKLRPRLIPTTPPRLVKRSHVNDIQVHQSAFFRILNQGSSTWIFTQSHSESVMNLTNSVGDYKVYIQSK